MVSEVQMVFTAGNFPVNARAPGSGFQKIGDENFVYDLTSSLQLRQEGYKIRCGFDGITGSNRRASSINVFLPSTGKPPDASYSTPDGQESTDTVSWETPAECSDFSRNTTRRIVAHLTIHVWGLD
jgi:hypothetical protein